MRPTIVFDSRGSSGNIYVVLGLTRTALHEQRRITDFNECRDRVFASGSYEEALAIVREYVDLVDASGEK